MYLMGASYVHLRHCVIKTSDAKLRLKRFYAVTSYVISPYETVKVSTNSTLAKIE